MTLISQQRFTSEKRDTFTEKVDKMTLSGKSKTTLHKNKEIKWSNIIEQYKKVNLVDFPNENIKTQSKLATNF